MGLRDRGSTAHGGRCTTQPGQAGRVSKAGQNTATGLKWCAVVDNIEGPWYDGIGYHTPVFSPDSMQVAYKAREGPRAFLVFAGARIGPECDEIAEGTSVFSTDGTRVACITISDAKAFLVVHRVVGTDVVDRVDGPKYDEIIKNSFQFSPDGKRWAYMARKEAKAFVVADGVEGRKYDDVGEISHPAQPDGKRPAYAARTGPR